MFIGVVKVECDGCLRAGGLGGEGVFEVGRGWRG